MGWVKNDDGRPMNRKARGLGYAANGLDSLIREISCHDKLDGWIPPPLMEELRRIQGETPKAHAAAVAKLIAVGRLHVLPGLEETCAKCHWNWVTRVQTPVPDEGHYSHDYGDYNPIGSEREGKTERARRASDARWNAQRNASSNALSNASGNASSNANALPHAGDDTSKEKKTVPAEVDAAFEKCWKLYPPTDPPTRSVKAKARRCFQATVTEGRGTCEQLEQATRAFAAAMAHKQPDHVMGAQRFYGRDEEWRAMLDARKAQAAASTGAFGTTRFT